MNKVLFYASNKNFDDFFKTQFFVVDIKILESLGNDVYLSNKISGALKFWKYDIAFLYFYRYSLFVALIARLFGKKVIFTGGIDALDIESATQSEYKKQKFLFKWCYRLSSKCIIVSKSDMDNCITALGAHKQWKKLAYSEHAISVDGYDLNVKKEKLFSTIVWQGSDENVIRKGVDVAIKLFSKLKAEEQFCDYRFCIMGGLGPGTQLIKNLCAKYYVEDSVYLTGFISEKEKKEILLSSEYYLQLSRYEGFGVAVLEALCAKNILIHSGRGGLNNPLFKANKTLLFDIFNDVSVETNKLKSAILNFNRSNVEILKKEIQSYYNIDRRKDDFERIIKGIF